MSKKIKDKKKRIYFIISLVIVLSVLYLFSNLAQDKDRKNCPYKTEGNLNADFVIKYVDSPYCIWCWLEEPVLKKMVETKGDLFKLEKYDIRYCTEIVSKYKISGTPSFVFSLENGTKEFPHMGFIGEVDFADIFCDVIGDCE